jgi:hypothetical protein
MPSSIAINRLVCLVRIPEVRPTVASHPVVLDITAEQGPGNLLGNLLCAVAGLLDPPTGGGGLGGLLNGIVALLNQILGQL